MAFAVPNQRNSTMSKAAFVATIGSVFPAGAIFAMAAPDNALQTLRDQLAALVTEAEAVVAEADTAERDLTDDELGRIDAIAAQREQVERQIAAREAVGTPPAAQPRRAASEVRTPGTGGTAAARPGVPAQPRLNDARRGFDSFGTFAQAVLRNTRGDTENEHVRRLHNVATTYGNEGVGADGGFAVPPEFRREIWQKVLEQENLLTRCAPLRTGSNNITIPKDETTPWQTSDGIQVYWESEGAQATNSKPQLEMLTIRLNKLMALVPLSDELMEDAVGLESWLRAKAPAKMAAKINTSIIRGTGAGQPRGLLNSACLISVAKESSQPADTVYFANINKMWSRMYAPCRRSAVWLINQDIEPQLDGMAFDPGATSMVPAYLPPGGASDSPYARLKGRPVVPIEACSTLGDKGDIILADLNEYWALTKGTGVQTDVSMHLYFDQGLSAFRFIFRVNGQPAWGAAIQPENGTNTRSCFVTLDERG
jgi:HK97 family phage major capsid protein